MWQLYRPFSAISVISNIRTWLTEIEQSDWLDAVVQQSDWLVTMV